MLVMAETYQSAMGPYVAMAVVGLVLYAWTAVIREALVMKVPGDEGEGEGGGLGGTGQAVWQTYLRRIVQRRSFHLPGPPN